MPYNNIFPVTYQPQQYVNPGIQYQQQPQVNNIAQTIPQQTPQVPVQNNTGIIWVQGEEAAKAYLVAAGNTVWLMDSESPTFYLKSTDVNGIPQKLRVFDFTERGVQGDTVIDTQASSVQIPDLSNYIQRDELEELLSEIKSQIPAKATRGGKTTNG